MTPDEFTPAVSPDLTLAEVRGWGGPLCECGDADCERRLPVAAWLYVQGPGQSVVAPGHPRDGGGRRARRSGFDVVEGEA